MKAQEELIRGRTSMSRNLNCLSSHFFSVRFNSYDFLTFSRFSHNITSLRFNCRDYDKFSVTITSREIKVKNNKDSKDIFAEFKAIALDKIEKRKTVLGRLYIKSSVTFKLLDSLSKKDRELNDTIGDIYRDILDKIEEENRKLNNLLYKIEEF